MTPTDPPKPEPATDAYVTLRLVMQGPPTATVERIVVRDSKGRLHLCRVTEIIYPDPALRVDK